MHWYEDVMKLGLRDTLKEVGFKRKSRAKFVCDHSPDRVWVVELHMGEWGGPEFNMVTGIYVPAIGEILKRLHSGNAWHPTGMRAPTHLLASIGDLVKIERGWDTLNWDKNPRSRTLILGLGNAPPLHRVLAGYWDDSGWDPHRVERTLSRLRKFWYSLPHQARKVGDFSSSESYLFPTLWLGPRLDALWRHYVLDWLQRCDDPVYLAEWLDRYILHEPSMKMSYELFAITTAAAYFVAGNNQQAGEVLQEMIATIGDPPEPDPSDEVARAFSDRDRMLSGMARQLADEYGIKL